MTTPGNSWNRRRWSSTTGTTGASTSRQRTRENKYLDSHGWTEYGRWYLGIDDDEREETKGRYKFPYGDFSNVHRCGVIAAEARAEQRKYHDIGSAAAHLHGGLDAIK